MNLASALRQAADLLEKIGEGKDIGLPAYRLKKRLCDLPAGTVFVHDQSDDKLGTSAYGCMKLAWCRGNCQVYVAGAFVLPGQEAENEEWFEPIHNDGSYTV